MLRKFYAAALLFALACAALDAPPPALADTPAPALAVGDTVADFKLPDVSGGSEKSLASLKGTKGTVLIFISVQCPVSNAYNERMEKLSRDLKAKGVNVVGINSNATEASEAVRAHASEKGFSFAVLKDPGNKLADRLGARVTPEVFFLDSSNKLVYRGRIDNSRDGEQITSDDLRDAVEATLSGKPVTRTEALAFGCSIKRAS
ncbi:MAG TPA: thioredoxin family protein [Pyrinomonadaceae bacterium]